MDTQHPYRLRPYHNPEGIDESRVPEGWRFRYKDEMHEKARWARFYLPYEKIWISSISYGRERFITYIVPVES